MKTSIQLGKVGLRLSRVLAVALFALPSALQAQVPRLSPPATIGATLESQAARLTLQRFPYRFASPWSLAFLPDGRILVTERGGQLLLIDGTSVASVGGLPRVAAAGQGGLLDVILHPDFKANRLVYLSFSAPGSGGASTAVFRGSLVEETGKGPTLAGGRVIWESARKSAGGIHFGSRLAFDAAGYLFVSTGERGEGSRARDLADAQGKILRLRDDGGIPPDNPFVGRAGALPEIWSYGHRNPQGLAINPADGLPWLTEHGPMGGDEVNVSLRGADYGWDRVTYGRAYSGAKVGEGTSAPGIQEPILYWTPSIAPSGLVFYRGTAFPAWNGNLFSGALAGTQLRRVTLDGRKLVSQEVLLSGTIGRIRDVRVGPDGYLYLLSDGNPGYLYRLEPAR